MVTSRKKGARHHTTTTAELFSAEEAADSGTLQTDPPLGKGELILVVDDEESIREITRGTLETFGYRVATARVQQKYWQLSHS